MLSPPEPPKQQGWQVSSCWTLEMERALCGKLEVPLSQVGLRALESDEAKCVFTGSLETDLIALEIDPVENERRQVRACLSAIPS